MNLRALLINVALSCVLVGFLAYGCTLEAAPHSNALTQSKEKTGG